MTVIDIDFLSCCVSQPARLPLSAISDRPSSGIQAEYKREISLAF